MITIAMATAIDADRKQVWRALTHPEDAVARSRALIGALDVPPDYPRPGQHARWRYRLRGVPVMLHDRVLEVVDGKRLRSTMALGLFRFDVTYTLEDEVPRDAQKSKPGRPRRARLGMSLAASNVVPVVGNVLDRFAVRKLATEIVASTLDDVRGWCEARRPPTRKAKSKSKGKPATTPPG